MFKAFSIPRKHVSTPKILPQREQSMGHLGKICLGVHYFLKWPALYNKRALSCVYTYIWMYNEYRSYKDTWAVYLTIKYVPNGRMRYNYGSISGIKPVNYVCLVNYNKDYTIRLEFINVYLHCSHLYHCRIEFVFP